MTTTVMNTTDTNRAFTWGVAIMLLAGIPAFHMLATWDWDSSFTPVNEALRHYSMPVMWLELTILFFSSRAGWHPSDHFLGLPVTARWLFALLGISILVTTVSASHSPVISALFALRYVLHMMLLSCLIFLIFKDSGFDLRQWTIRLSSGAAIYLFLLVIFCTFVPNSDNFEWLFGIPSATNIRQIGNLLALLALAPTVIFLFDRSRSTMLSALVLVTAIMIFIMWSGTRGALLGLTVAVAFASALMWDKIARNRIALLALASMVALGISTLLPIPSGEYGIIRMAGSFQTEDASSGRLKMWSEAIAAIQNAPLFGYGSGTYRENMLLLNGNPYNHPHNFILQFVYDWGLIGGTMALSLLAWFGLAVLRATSSQADERFLSLAGLTCLIATALIEGTLFHPLPIIVAIACMAPHIARHCQVKNSSGS
jgi:O-antigen ligase